MNNDSRAPRRVGVWLLLLLVSALLCCSVVVNGLLVCDSLWCHGGQKNALQEQGEDDAPQFHEIWASGQGKTKVVQIDLIGLISRDIAEGWLGITRDFAAETLRKIKAASDDEDVKGLILLVDSPGGYVTPADEIYHALEDFKGAAAGRKVVVFIRDMAASGAYYIAMAGDWLVAEPTAEVGSIGVMIQALNWQVLAEKIGVRDVTVTSGANKDLLNPFKSVQTNQVQILQELVDEDYDRFLQIVSRGRKLDPALVKTLADGRVFTASKALRLGLVDEIGYWNDAIKTCARLLDVEKVKVVRYEREEPAIWEWLAQLTAPLNLRNLFYWSTPRCLYCWRL